MDITKSIKTLKAQCGITNKDIAGITGRSKTSVSNWCTGKAVPDFEIIALLCANQGVKLSTFCKWGE